MAEMNAKTLYDFKSFNEIYRVWIERRSYGNGRTALVLMNEMGQVAVVTVNLPGEDLGVDEIFVKTWSENEGMPLFLIENHIAEDTGRRIPTGHAEAWVMRVIHG